MTLSPRGAAALQVDVTSLPSEPIQAEITSGAPPAAGRGVPWGRGLLISLVAAFAVPMGLGFYADFGDVSTTLAGFQWNLVPALLGLTALNYLVRYLRWRKLLELASGQSPGLWQDLLVFFAGTAMILTPARLGEWVKSYYARQLYGAPVARTAPIPLVERITDTLVMLLLATTGVVLFDWDKAVFLAVGVIAVVAIMALRHRGLASLLSRCAARFPAARRLLPPMEDFHDSSRLLLSPPGLSWAFGLGLAGLVAGVPDVLPGPRGPRQAHDLGAGHSGQLHLPCGVARRQPFLATRGAGSDRRQHHRHDPGDRWRTAKPGRRLRTPGPGRDPRLRIHTWADRAGGPHPD